MRLRQAVAILVLMAATGCRGGLRGGPGGQAEILPTPLTAVVLAAHPGRAACIDDGCPMRYRLRISNPVDQDAYVQTCAVGDPAVELWAGGPPAGEFIQGLGRERVDTMSYVALEKGVMADLVGISVFCTGLDWHGSPPP